MSLDRLDRGGLEGPTVVGQPETPRVPRRLARRPHPRLLVSVFQYSLVPVQQQHLEVLLAAGCGGYS